jgi:hypothetical protein
MPADLYTKTVLTLIAGALVVIAWQGAVRPANAQFATGCGLSQITPCYVTPSTTFGGFPVSVMNWPPRF